MSTDTSATTPAPGSALSREIGAIKQPKGSFRLALPVWSATPVAPYDQLYCEMYETPGVILATHHLSKARGHAFGRNADWCDQVLAKHPSISRQHAAVVHTKQGPVLIDLFSSHGATIQGVKLIPGRPYQLMEGDVVKFGAAPGSFKFKGTGHAKRGATEKPEPFGTSSLTASEGDDTATATESSTTTSTTAAASGDKRRREGDSGSSRKDVKTESGRVASSSSGLADPATGRIWCHHLLVKHAGSRRPSSWRQEVITITKEEARTKLEGLRQQLLPYVNDIPTLQSKFEALASKHSDCSSYKHGGDLGFFTYPKMQPAFSKAAFELRVGEMTPNLVETDSGVHIILRKE